MQQRSTTTERNLRENEGFERVHKSVEPAEIRFREYTEDERLIKITPRRQKDRKGE